MSVEVIDRGWDRITREISALGGLTVEVGIPQGAAYPDGTPVALVGAVHEYGSDDVPARPWLTPGWDKARKAVEAECAKLIGEVPEGRPDARLRRVEEIAREAVLSALDGVSAPPLKASTVRAKGNAKILYDTGTLRASIVARVTKGAG